MILGAATPALSLLNFGTRLSHLDSSAKQHKGSVVACSASKHASNKALTGFVFEPFQRVNKELMLLPTAPHLSLARHNYSDDSESVINDQINVEYNLSYVYHAMFVYFDRDNVALKGFARYFKESSAEERDQAEQFMEYQNKCGGKVKLQSIIMPLTEFDHAEKGDALYAMELALSLQKLANEKLQHLHKVAVKNKDAQMADFVQNRYLRHQVKVIKRVSEYVAQLRRVGKGHGVWHFDKMLLNEGGAA
ncbi:hypothetical protein DCAR_0728489 [Daucus carota subsp. sativus]|uniref:Ferritin n=1 Tax=Daucus carota subsp. sativus TaxID=79200 RepID=A0A164TLW4_DAUCS|nr:PREDICTED: ferritin-2, chloroplastic [Daucus carota subsp. sativus]WOH09036.1 hypothetical protein DCAR_0728489 [Daucus carota subsp. sativus]